MQGMWLSNMTGILQKNMAQSGILQKKKKKRGLLMLDEVKQWCTLPRQNP